MRNSGQIAKRRINIQVRNQSVNHLAAGEAAGPAHDQRDTPAVVFQVALHEREGHAMIRRADDERVAGERVAIQRIENLADGAIRVSRAGVKSGRVEAGFRSVGNRCRRKRVAGVIGGRRLGIFAVAALTQLLNKPVHVLLDPIFGMTGGRSVPNSIRQLTPHRSKKGC